MEGEVSMFQIKPVASKIPAAIPFPQVDITSTMRLITTKHDTFVVPTDDTDNVQYLCIRLNRTNCKKTVTLPNVPVDGSIIVIHDMNGYGLELSTEILLTNSQQFEEPSLRLRYGASILVLRYYTSYSTPSGALSKCWVKLANFTRTDLPFTDPTRDEDTIVEKRDDDTFIVLSNPNADREVVFSPQGDTPDGSLPNSNLYFIFDSANTSSSNPITFTFNDCTLQGHSQAIMSGNNGLVVLRQDSDGNFSYLYSTGATLLDGSFDFASVNHKSFGFSTSTSFGDPNTAGFWDAAQTATKGGHLSTP
jgi:hypothetical protein